MVKVGSPIRKSPDQSLLTTPRRLSQRATSFIACTCQGIHQMPLPNACESTPSTTGMHIASVVTGADDNLSQINICKCRIKSSSENDNPCATASIKNPFTMSKKRADPANPQPEGCEVRVFISGAVNGTGGAYRDRTDDPLLAKQVLSQLS